MNLHNWITSFFSPYTTMRIILIILLLTFFYKVNPAYCKDAPSVKAAEYATNLKTCLNGHDISLCRHNILSKQDAVSVKAAEYAANLKTCLNGRYISLCRHNILSKQDALSVKAAEYNNKPSFRKNICAENGSCYGDPSSKTGNSKIVHVKGYYRKNGTYVRGHYRSK